MLDQFLHFLFQVCVDTLYALSFHNENQSKRREYITCTEPGRVNVIKCLPFIFVTQWKILLLQFSLTFESLFFGRSYPSYEYTKEEFAHEGPLSRLVTTTHPSNPFNKVDKWSSRPKKLCKRADHSKFIFVN